MNLINTLSIIILILDYVPSVVTFTFAQNKDCKGIYRSGSMPRKLELDEILLKHGQWLSIYREKVSNTTTEERTDPRRANLCNANLRPPVKLRNLDLSGADLQGANLEGNDLTGLIVRGAELQFANMSRTTLSGVKLSEAYSSFLNLHKANLLGADLSSGGYMGSDLSEVWFADGKMMHADLQGVSLRNSLLPKADLSHSFLLDVDLSGAGLEDGNLAHSTLSNVNLSKTRLIRTNLANVVIQGGIFNGTFFEPMHSESLMILDSKGLSTVVFSDPRPLVTLRKNIKEAGMRGEERALTSALRKFELKSAPPHERYAQLWLFGGILTDFGADPWGSLKFLPVIILLFSIPYAAALNRWGGAGIWAIWSAESTQTGQSHRSRVTAQFFGRNAGHTELKTWSYWLLLFWGALYFSLLSAFHIGWRDLNVGTWISRLQPRDYTLRATGWVKTVSGVQSLLSVYLLALWALTYFGRPFE